MVGDVQRRNRHCQVCLRLNLDRHRVGITIASLAVGGGRWKTWEATRRVDTMESNLFNPTTAREMEDGRWKTGEAAPLGRQPGINLFNPTMSWELEDGRWVTGAGRPIGSTLWNNTKTFNLNKIKSTVGILEYNLIHRRYP